MIIYFLATSTQIYNRLHRKFHKNIPFRQENLDWAECVTLSLPHTKFSGVFDRRTATRSKAFSLFISLDATTFVLISVITHIETIYLKILTKPRPKSAKGLLLVGIELGNDTWYSNEAIKYITVNNDRYEGKQIASILMTPPGPNPVCGDTKTAFKMDFYHFLWNFTCHFVNKAYAKKRKNIFMHFNL